MQAMYKNAYMYIFQYTNIHSWKELCKIVTYLLFELHFVPLINRSAP